MSRISPEAAFDVLAVAMRLDPLLEGVMTAEIHLFAYLGCLLSLYQERPVSEWGYGFAATPEGAPFSAEIAAATDQLCRAGHLCEGENTMRITAQGKEEYSILSELALNAQRDRCIAGACDCAVAIPVPVVRKAVSGNETMQRAEPHRARRLLERVALEDIYEQLSVLSKMLAGLDGDLMVPAVAWLSYLKAISEPSIQKQGVSP